ncbi:MAG TPA: nuclear transport factor 2 family protein [Chthoniobacterales bacterium]
MLRLLATAGVAALACCAPLRSVHAQEEQTREAIRQTALDYIEGWYEGNAERMERALHPELAKRIVLTKRSTGESRLENMDAKTLVADTRAGNGKDAPAEKQQKEVTILDLFGNAASVKVVASDWIDYMQMARFNGRWVIINVLWELKPRVAAQQPTPASGS